MIEELRTNATGHLGRRYKDRATKLADVEPSSLFPTGALDAYLRPATSPLHDPSQGWPGFGKGEPVYQRRGRARMEGRGDLDGFAKACERFFEWGTKDLVAKKFASESVGLFGSELVTCARERVRQADPVTSPVPAKQVDNKDSSPPLSTGRITSFFRSSASTRTRPTERRHSFENMPAHVHKIHSVRSDPTDAELNEYRVSFSTIEYIKRCHEVMDGHRVDPKELDTDSRAELGLVDKDTDIPPASQAAAIPVKEEARVWIPEYLIKEAWPELVDTYEAELAAKAKPKSKIKSKTTKSTKKAPSASGENTQAFKSFFLTQRPTVPPQPASSDVEEEEILEDLPPRMPSSRGSSRSFSTDSHNRQVVLLFHYNDTLQLLTVYFQARAVVPAHFTPTSPRDYQEECSSSSIITLTVFFQRCTHRGTGHDHPNEIHHHHHLQNIVNAGLDRTNALSPPEYPSSDTSEDKADCRVRRH